MRILSELVPFSLPVALTLGVAVALPSQLSRARLMPSKCWGAHLPLPLQIPTRQLA